jgi:hypothetical protein
MIDNAIVVDSTALCPAAQATLLRWHAMVSQRDFSQLHELMSGNPVFRSPIAHNAYSGTPAVCMILSAALTTLSDFKYERYFVADSLNVALEFRARVDDREVKGIDLIRFAPDGAIAEFEVMLRPMSAAAVFAEHMKSKVGPQLKTLSGTP